MSADLSHHERERLLENFGRRFAAGDVIYREGEPGRELFILQEGRVRVLKRVRGVERSLQILKTGDLFGEGALLAGVARTATAIALSDLVVLALTPETFEALLQGSSAVAMRLIQQLVRRLRDAEDQLENMMLYDASSKIINALLKLASESGRGAGSAQVPVSPLELSARAGLDVDAVKRGVLHLRERDYVRIVDEKVVIDDVDALRRLFVLLGTKDEIRS